MGGGVLLAYNVVVAIVDWLARVEYVGQRLSDPGWIGKVLGFLADPPPWFMLLTILVGLVLIYWHHWKSRASGAIKTLSTQAEASRAVAEHSGTETAVRLAIFTEREILQQKVFQLKAMLSKIPTKSAIEIIMDGDREIEAEIKRLEHRIIELTDMMAELQERPPKP